VTVRPRPWRAIALVAAGGGLAMGAGVVASYTTGAVMLDHLQQEANAAIRESSKAGRHSAKVGVWARFVDPTGQPSRRPMLAGGTNLSDSARAKIADAVRAVPGVAGVWWASHGSGQGVGQGVGQGGAGGQASAQCQSTVEAILKTRTIRFAEARVAIDASSNAALDEVAAALRPCAGFIVAIIGHTDAAGDEAQNLALSAARASAVRNALAARGLDMAGLRVRGAGSAQPLPGLDGADPANRRISFSVITPVSLEPSVVDTPGPD